MFSVFSINQSQRLSCLCIAVNVSERGSNPEGSFALGLQRTFPGVVREVTVEETSLLKLLPASGSWVCQQM